MKKKLFSYRGEAFCVLLGIIFITIAATWESPIYKGAYGFDASFFSMMGRAILHGKVPYRDYFDIKGPAFFFIEALGQLIHKNRQGVYIIECIASSFSMIYILKICRLYALSLKKTFSVFFCVIIIFFTTLWGGNTAEEFLLPLNLACIYYGLKFIKESLSEVGTAFLFGITISIGVFSKITIIVPTVAILICILVYLLINKRYFDLLMSALLFLAGFAMVMSPILLYFAFRGALSDMINAAFIIAFKRSTDYYEGFSMKWESYLIICYVGFVMSLARFKIKSFDKWFLGVLSVLTFIALHLGTPFDYYFTTTIPLYVFIIIIICKDVEKLYILENKELRYIINNLLFAVIGLVVAISVYTPKTVNKIRECNYLLKEQPEIENYRNYREIFKLIPKKEYKDVFCIESGMILYEVNQVLPTSKYPVNFPYFTQLYPPSKNEVLYKLYNDSPKWIVSEEMECFEIDEIRDFVLNNYTLITDNPVDQLWRLNN